MARAPIPKAVQEKVLLGSRRRCCICYGLNRDTDIKQGQIAHLDHSNSNNELDNLAFLCLDHHDEYDSPRSQSKGLSIGEVKEFRRELLAAIGEQFSLRVHFGSISLPKNDPYAGQYIRTEGSSDSAEVEVTPLPDAADGTPRYAVTGFALWGTDREFGPNMGSLEFIAPLVDGELAFQWPRERGEAHTVLLRFEGESLTIEEANWLGAYGMNVTFAGHYRRA